MGSQQGDDLQLNGDLACENAEIRSELRAKTLLVNGSPVTSGIGVENAGAPVAGGPFTSIDLQAVGGLVAVNEGGGVAGLRTTSPMPLDVLGGDPGPQAGKAIAYSKAVVGVSQLFVQSDDGSVHQVTDAPPVPVPATDPTVGAAYTEDFEGLQKVTTVAVLGGTATLVENPIFDFVGNCELASAASGDAVAVNTSQSKLFMDLGAGFTTFKGRLQPPFGPPTALADFVLVIGMVQNFAPNVVGIGSFFQAGFALNGNSNWWAVDTQNGLLQDTGVPVNTGGPSQQFAITYQRNDQSQFFINGALVATIATGGSALAVGLQAKWNDISRGGDAFDLDYLSYTKVLAR